VFGREPEADTIEELLAALAPLTTSRLTYVEVRSALAAARRSGRLTAAALGRARAELDGLWPMFFVLDVDAATADVAADVAERFALRSHDAVQLASALRIQDPAMTMVALDRRLLRAASAAGLQVAG